MREERWTFQNQEYPSHETERASHQASQETRFLRRRNGAIVCESDLVPCRSKVLVLGSLKRSMFWAPLVVMKSAPYSPRRMICVKSSRILEGHFLGPNRSRRDSNDVWAGRGYGKEYYTELIWAPTKAWQCDKSAWGQPEAESRPVSFG